MPIYKCSLTLFSCFNAVIADLGLSVIKYINLDKCQSIFSIDDQIIL